MTIPIRPIQPPDPIDTVSLSSLSGAKKLDAAGAGEPFSNLLDQSIARVEQFQQDAQAKTESLLRGDDRDIHEVVLAGQRAELTFDYFMQVRNKVVQAYQEVMRMQM